MAHEHHHNPPGQPPQELPTGAYQDPGATVAATAAATTTTTIATTSSVVLPAAFDDSNPQLYSLSLALPSRSSSFEADDELSATGPPSSTSPSPSPVYRNRRYSHSSDSYPMAGHRATGLLAAGDDAAGESSDGQHPTRLRQARRRQGGDGSASYPGEDTRPTTSREIFGWYMYSFASETYVICAVASFIPILLESLAHENGVLLSDRTTPCNAATPAFSPASFNYSAEAAASDACVVYVFGLEVNTASFAMYTFSISVLLQALLVVSISCAADHGNYRKTLLLTFAAAGSITVMLFVAVSARTYLLAALLAIVSNTSYGASIVLLNSFLPLLVRNHPAVLRQEDVEPAARFSEADAALEDDASSATLDDSIAGINDSTTALLPSSRSRTRSPSPAIAGSVDSESTLSPSSLSPHSRHLHEEQTSAELILSTQLSARGVGIGYCSALFVLCVAITVIFRMHSTTWSQQVALFGIGLWWLLFSIPTALWLRPRPGPPLPATRVRHRGWFAYIRAWGSYLSYAWKALFRTISLARRLRDIVLFLAGWFLLSDAIATTSSTAILFAKTQLHMKVWALGLISVVSTVGGVIGALGWAAVSRRVSFLRAKPMNTILACVALFELIPLYGLLGYVPFVRNWGVGGLQKPWEMYLLASVYGLVLGGISSYCRSLYGELIPPGSEAAFYALYAITDKGSSVFGPAIVGAIIDATGEIRPAFWFLAVLVGLPFPLLYFVNVERGRIDGERLAITIEGFRPGVDNGNGTSSGHGSDAHGSGETYDEDDTGSVHTPRAILADYDDDEDEDAALRR